MVDDADQLTHGHEAVEVTDPAVREPGRVPADERAGAVAAPIDPWHALEAEHVRMLLGTPSHGLTAHDAAQRLETGTAH